MSDEIENKALIDNCNTITSFCVDYVLLLHEPEVNDDFPEFPEDFPAEQRYASRLQPLKVKLSNASTSSKSSQSTTGRKSRVQRKSTNGIPSRPVAQNRGKRAKRFQGSYKKQLGDPDKSSDSSEEDIKCEKEKKSEAPPPPSTSVKCAPKIVVKLKKPGKKTLSDSSSSSGEEDNGKLTEPPTLPSPSTSETRPKRFYDYLSESSSDEEAENNNNGHKHTGTLPKVNGKDQIVKISNVKNQAPNVSSIAQQLEKQRESQMHKLKIAFDHTKNFDEAMKLFASEVAKSKPARPAIIPPPPHDPMVKPKKMVNKTLVRQNTNERLGGIFTIDNGWDKENVQQKEEKEEEKIKPLVQKADRIITPPPQHMQVFDRDLDDDDLINGYCVDGGGAGAYGSDDSDEDDIPNLVIDFSHDEDEEEENEGEIEVDSQKPMFVELERKNSNVSRPALDDKDEEMKESADNDDEEDDAISIVADLGTLDDLDEPRQVIAELDGLKFTMKIQRAAKQVEESSTQEEFDKKTVEITENAVDPRTDQVLREHFGNVCPGFLENKCTLEQCKRRHSLLDMSSVRATIVRASTQYMREILPVLLRYYQLFSVYCVVFTEKFVNHNDQESLIEMVKGCDRHVRTRECLENIVRKIVDMDHWKVHTAIRFVIAHHVDSVIARETILRMILNSGPCIPFFMDYLEYIVSKQTICIDDFNRILHACVAYTNPRLPNFCLNYIQMCDPEKITKIHKANLQAFLKMQQCFSELNNFREAKLLAIVDKLQNAIN